MIRRLVTLNRKEEEMTQKTFLSPLVSRETTTLEVATR